MKPTDTMQLTVLPGLPGFVGWTEMGVTRRLVETCSQPPRLNKQWACLQNLEEINYYVSPTNVLRSPVQPVELLLWLFLQPNIKTIRIRVVEEQGHLWEWPSSPLLPRKSGLTSLCLTDSCLRLDSLRHLLRCTPNLRRLKYQQACEMATSPEECMFLDCDKLGQILGEVSASLKDLSLSIFFFFYTEKPLYTKFYDRAYCGIWGSLGSMAHFSNLKYLKVPLVMLLGWRPPPVPVLDAWLPEGLLGLYLTSDLMWPGQNEWYVRDIVVQMRSMILNSGARQHLKRFSLRSLKDEPRWCRMLIDEIHKACDRQL
ncbi:MAG: hypothetical protein Q9182_006738 [Xanthomendoza sp. 2 TL-2023]